MSAATLQIRRAEIEDAPALWRAEVETAEVPGRLISRPHELALASFEARIRELHDSGGYFVACDDQGVCGHAVLERMPLEAMAHVRSLTIVVHPGHTGRGIGSALLEHVQRWAATTQGVHKLELRVRACNTRALQLYRRVGFVEEGRFRERVRLPDGTLVDDIAMAWFPNQ
jgi:RimJ/RimL family protein N-acetyltransferase